MEVNHEIDLYTVMAIIAVLAFGLLIMFEDRNGGSQNAYPEAVRAKNAALVAKQAKEQAKQAEKQAEEKARQEAAEESARDQAIQNLWTMRQWAQTDGSAIMGTLSSIGPDKILIVTAETPARSRIIWCTNLIESDQQLVSLAAAKQEHP
jgi:uncharacterized protein YlxW (UPF0749 family)